MIYAYTVIASLDYTKSLYNNQTTFSLVDSFSLTLHYYAARYSAGGFNSSQLSLLQELTWCNVRS